ncbi:UbiA family prenyltransferase [Streptomyces sp. NPDC058371]|uniref:UbiA family prenyltransferase n=1 Tax=Streptomyces sp. NPDC058371 TaxID=3346463 RepID=UPI00364B3ED7
MLDSASPYGTGSRIVATCTVVRPITCLLAALSAACGGFLASDLSRLASVRGVLSMLCMAGLMGVANAVNDIVDLPADRISKPQRPIASGRVPVYTAWSVVTALAILTLATAAALGLAETLLASALLFLAFAYSYRFKDTVFVGNVTVGIVCCGTLVFGSLTSGRLTPSSGVAAAVILLFVVAYEIVKTLQDREADSAAGLRTLATAYEPGVSVAAFTAVAAVLCVTALGVGSPFSSEPVPCLVLLLLFLIAPVGLCAHILRTWPDRAGSTARSLLILRLAWFPGLLSLTLLK